MKSENQYAVIDVEIKSTADKFLNEALSSGAMLVVIARRGSSGQRFVQYKISSVTIASSDTVKQ